jgi:menaquinone-9 beta-reductase
MKQGTIYDTAIIGGGLAGLSLSILLARKGHTVILFEKEIYPFHKVCGEYISLESWDFICSLGLPLSEMNLPIIKELVVTAPDGTRLTHTLDLGGFGISRFTLDNALKDIALQSGVELVEGCKVESVDLNEDIFSLKTGKGNFNSRVCAGSYGKRSNLDIKWKRPFTLASKGKLNNYIGIKYHVQANLPENTIALHNFRDGYCGISKIEGDTYCLCYLTNAANLKRSNNSIAAMEKNILWENPFLREIFRTSTSVYTTPVSISQISFMQKTQVEDHVLMLGDAAGMIAPLCGNGMSMAMHSAKLAAGYVAQFLSGHTSRQQMETKYTRAWRKHFSGRLRTGRWIQRFFGKTAITNLFVKLMKRCPALTRDIVRRTHGKRF